MSRFHHSPDWSKPRSPETHCPEICPAYLGEKILNIRYAEGKTMISPDGMGNDLTRKAETLQARHGRCCSHEQ